jgi:hypothetical protein
MKIRPAFISLAFLAVAGVAFAAPALQRVLEIFSGGIRIGMTGSDISDSYAGSATVNFGDIAAGDCEESSAATVTGAALGDPCLVSDPGSADAGVAYSLSCRASASNAVKVRACAEANTNIPSSTFYFRVIDP